MSLRDPPAGRDVVAVALTCSSRWRSSSPPRTRDQLIDQVDDRLRGVRPERGRAIGQAAADRSPTCSSTVRPDPGRRLPVAHRQSDVYQGVVSGRELRARFTPIFARRAPHRGPTWASRRRSAGPPDRSPPAPRTTTDDLPGARQPEPFGTCRSPACRSTTCESTIPGLSGRAAGSAAILAVLGMVTWWVIRLGIRPIKQMTEAATRDRRGQPRRSGPGRRTGDRVRANSPSP